MKKFLKFALPVVYLLIGTGVIISWDLFFKDKVNKTEVVVAKETIGFKEELTEENIEIITVNKDSAISDGVKPDKLESILGKNASIEIKKGTQLYTALVDQYNLIPNEKEGEFIAPIPDEWLFAVPGSLRKTFIADFYAIPDKSQAIIRSIIEEAETGTEDVEAESTEEENNELDETNEKPVKTNSIVDLKIIQDHEAILTDVIVASVKDSSNKEVVETKENPETATGTVADLEIIANDKMLTTLRKYTEQGYKIYVVYKFDRN